MHCLLNGPPAEDFRWIYYAGSPIDVPTFLEATERFDARLVQSFAQMEAPMFLTSLGSDDHRRADKDEPGARKVGRPTHPWTRNPSGEHRGRRRAHR